MECFLLLWKKCVAVKIYVYTGRNISYLEFYDPILYKVST